MPSNSSEQILIPSKFIALILHLIVVTMGFFSYVNFNSIQHDNILSAYHDLTAKTDINYVGGEASFLACSIITVIFLFVEIVILFVGVTMFR